jgi:hypothetical protein
MRGGNLINMNELFKEIVTKNILHALLIAFVASAYAEDTPPSLRISNMPAEKAGQTNWEVQGSIGNKVVVVNGRGDTSAVEIGSEIDGCLVTVRKVICDTAEKEAIKNNDRETNEAEVLRRKEEELQKQLSQLNQEKKEVEAIAGRREKDNKELIAIVGKLKDELAQKKSAAVSDTITAPSLKINALVYILESIGKSGYSPDLGGIKFVIADDKLIVRVDRGAGDRAKTLLQKAILEEAKDNGYVYYALDKNMVQINYKQE